MRGSTVLTRWAGALLLAWAAVARAGTPAPPEAYDTLHVVVELPFAFVSAGELQPTDAGGRIAQPAGVATDAFGRVSVSDAGVNALLRWGARGEWLDVTGGLGSEAGQFRRIAAVTRQGSAGMAVLDVENRRVVSYDLQGHLRGVLVDLAALEGDPFVGRVRPVGIACDRGGALFVADGDRDRVVSFDFTGRFQRVIGGFGPKPGSFQRLAGVATGPDGALVTSEHPSRPARKAVAPAPAVRVQRLDASGRPLGAWMVPVGSARAEGELPVAVDDSSRVALADERGGDVWLFAREGTPLATMDGLAGPVALAFAPDGSLLVAEAAAGRVRRFRIEPAGRNR